MDRQTTFELQKILRNIHSEPELNEYLGSAETLSPYTSFADYFLSLPEVSEMPRTELIRKSGLERTYAYQILNGTREKPGRDKILRLCLAAGLDADRVRKALEAGKEAPLYPRNRRDAILIFAVNKKCGVDDAQMLLDSFGEKLI